jgi:DNA-binding MarR family transcriptional regulator
MSKYFWTKGPPVAKQQAQEDVVDRMVGQWAAVRPDLELGPMATIGRLGRLQGKLTRAVEGVLADHGLQLGDFDVLATLRRAGEPYTATPTALARAVMLSPAGMTSRVDRLVRLGLVARRSDPDDRRSSFVVLTDEGRRRIDAAVTDHVENEARLVGVLDTTERRQLDGLLRKLLGQFETNASPAL